MTENNEKNQLLSIDDFPGKTVKLPDGTITKNVYIVKIEDPSMKTKISSFVTAKIDVLNHGVDFIGYLVATKNSDSVKTIQDAVDLANKGEKELYSITYPWCRVISVRNVSYRTKQ